MWLPWRRTKNDGESAKALKEARKHIHDARRKGDEVTELVDSFREFRQHNHFAEQLEMLLFRRRGD